MTKCACLLLAAGGSRRFGTCKLEAKVNEHDTLLEHVASQLVALKMPLFVVLGGHRHRLEPLPKLEGTTLIHHAQWQNGIGSSIAKGITTMAQEFDAVMITLGDQVAITSNDYRSVLRQWHNAPENIVAAHYENTLGVPAIFPKRFYSALSSLEGDKGAKPILMQHQSRLVSVPMPHAKCDIDTPEQLHHWQKRH